MHHSEVLRRLIGGCIGLEFDDVLLYKFFSSSEIPEAWDFVHGSPLKAHRSHRNSAPPPFLCNDLKLLYVAITRARKRCWIWDHGHVYDAMQVSLTSKIYHVAGTDKIGLDFLAIPGTNHNCIDFRNDRLGLK
jgi:hypothetical protein